MKTGDIILINNNKVRVVLGMNKTHIVIFEDPILKTLELLPSKDKSIKVITFFEATKILIALDAINKIKK